MVTPSAASMDTVKAVRILVPLRATIGGSCSRSQRLARQRQADQAAAEARHEVDGFGRDVVGGQHEVAFVLAVFLVDQDHHAAGAHVGDDVFDRRDGAGDRPAWRGDGVTAFMGGGFLRVRQAPPSMRST